MVRPTDFATNQTLDGTSATTFDDEAVLVLSEVDPAFDAAPATFNLKAFRPTHRLINGQESPNSTAIATDHGRRTLLRYVNGGVLGHSMGVLGVKEQVLAVNGHANGVRPSLVSDMIAAGQTEDALVAFPSGGADQLPVYETAGTLDNAGRPSARPASSASAGCSRSWRPAPLRPATTSARGQQRRRRTEPRHSRVRRDGDRHGVRREHRREHHRAGRVRDRLAERRAGSGTAMSAVDGAFDEVTEPSPADHRPRCWAP